MANEAETATRFVDSVLMNCAAVGSRKFLAIVDQASTDDTRKILEAHAAKVPDMTSGFTLFTREALEIILRRGIRSRGPFFQTEMKAHCRDLKVVEVPIQYRSPTHVVGSTVLGDALVNLWRLFRARLAGSL